MHKKKVKVNKFMVDNRKTIRHFQIIKTWEAGIILKGFEVKAILNGNFDFSKSYVFISSKQEVFLTNFKFKKTKEKQQTETNLKLLLNKSEIILLKNKKESKKLTIIATKIYLKKTKIKVEIALAQGLKKYQKKQTLIAKDLKKQHRTLGKIFKT